MSKTKTFTGITAVIASLFLACLMMMGIPSQALAANESEASFADTAGNLLFAGSGEYRDEIIDNTFFWAGQGLTVEDSEIGLDVFGAGQSISFTNANIGSNAFFAGQSASLSNTAVKGNVFFAGQLFYLSETSSAKALYLFGQEIDIKGRADFAYIAANEVTLSGTISGDAIIEADQVTIAPDAVVEGSLEIRSPEEPTVPDSASIGSYTFTQITTGETVDDEEFTADVETNSSTGAIIAFIGSLIGAAIAGLLIYWLNRRTLSTAATYLKTRPAALLVSGLIAIAALPVVAIIGFIVFSWKISISLILAATMITLLATAFTGASIMQLIVPKLNPIAAAALGAAASVLLAKIPFIGFLFGLFAVMYAAGYVVQWIFLNSLGKPKAKCAEANNMSQQSEESIQADAKSEPPIAPIA